MSFWVFLIEKIGVVHFPFTVRFKGMTIIRTKTYVKPKIIVFSG